MIAGSSSLDFDSESDERGLCSILTTKTLSSCFRHSSNFTEKAQILSAIAEFVDIENSNN